MWAAIARVFAGVGGRFAAAAGGGGWIMTAAAAGVSFWLGMHVERGFHADDLRDRAEAAEETLANFEERVRNVFQSTEEYVQRQQQILRESAAAREELRPYLEDLRSCPLGPAGGLLNGQIDRANRLFGGTGAELDLSHDGSGVREDAAREWWRPGDGG